MDPYKILGLSANATLDEIKAAYYERAKRYHPDAGGDAWAFQQLQEAYEFLRKKHEGQTSSGESTASNSSSQDHDQPVHPASTSEAETEGIRPHEIPILAGVAGVVVVWMFWSWIWRLMIFGFALGFALLSTWLFLESKKYFPNDQLVKRGSGIVSTLLAMLCLYFGVFASAYTSIPLKNLKDTSTVIAVNWAERDVSQPQVSFGSAFVIEKSKDKIILLTNSHCLALQQMAEGASQQRDKTANVTNYKLEIVFPSGKKASILRIGESQNPNAVDAAKLEVSAQGLIEGKDFTVIPIIKNVIDTFNVAVDDEVRAVGAPNGLDATVSKGWVTNVRKSPPGGEAITAIQHSAPIDQGSSGGPLFLCRGSNTYCIGVNTLMVGGQSIGIARSIDEIAQHTYVWADASPTGAVELLGKVYGMAAAVGDQKPAWVTGYQNKNSSQPPLTNKQIDNIIFGKPPTMWDYVWPFTNKAPYLNGKCFPFWVAAVFLIRGLFQNWTASPQKKCPKCKRSSHSMYQDGICVLCGHDRGKA